jgi:hypothetical protein
MTNKRKKVSEEDFMLVCRFLEDEGYLDDDWWCEEPTAWERYNEEKQKPLKGVI